MELTLPLADLFTLEDSTSAQAAFYVLPRRAGARCLVTSPAHPDSTPLGAGWWATPLEGVGDAPGKYNAKYVMAVLSSKPAARVNQSHNYGAAMVLPRWAIPQISFRTEEATRRSMTLNGMRMSTEYFASGSLRVLQLIEQRLQVGQVDVVHDVLVYLMQQILDVRAQATEARLLRAESVAAYLGLDHNRVSTLFQSPRLVPGQIAASLEAGIAGKIRRSVEVIPLLENQVRHLQPALRHYRRQERHILALLDDVTLRLYQKVGV